MATKEINTRIALRVDSFEYWSKWYDTTGAVTSTPDDISNNYANVTWANYSDKGAALQLKRGEIALCEIPSDSDQATTAPTVLFKVGDGEHRFCQLRWASALAADVHEWAKCKDIILDGRNLKFMQGSTPVKSIDLSTFALDSDVDAAIGRIAALEGKFTGSESVDNQLSGIISRLTKLEGSGEGSVAKALADAKDYTDLRETAIETAYKAYADQAEADAKAYTATEVQTLTASISAVDDKVDAEKSNRESADEAINNKIGTVAEGKTVVEMISDAQTAAEAKVTELANGQVNTNKTNIENIQNDYLKATDKQELEGKISSNTEKIGTDIAAAKGELKGTSADASTAETIAGAKKYAEEKASAVQGNLNTLSGTVNTLSETVTTNNNTLTNSVAAVDREYKAADSALGTRIDNEETARKNADDALQTEINNIKDNIASGLHFRGIFDKLEDVTTPVEGDIAIIGTVEYIYDGETWQEFGDADAHATKSYVDTELAKKVDKTTYDQKVAALEAEDSAIRDEFADADAALKGELEGQINTKAASADLTAAVGRITTAEGDIDNLEETKLDAAIHTTFIQEYATDKAALAADIKEVDDRLNASGDIKVAIDAAKDQADKGVADAATAQSGVNSINELVGTGFSSSSTIADQLAAVKATADAAAVKQTVDSAIAALQEKDTAHEERMTNIESAASALADRVAIAEGAITRIDGEIDGHDTKIAALEGKVDVDKVSTAISSAVATEKEEREAADAALDTRIDAYDERFGTKDDLLLLNCGTSSTNI